jgi:ubiquinol-cytochrome c reductase iron-sulfur subunit
MATLEDGVPPDQTVGPRSRESAPSRLSDLCRRVGGGVGAGVVVLPLINSMNPSADVLAQSSTEVDLSKIEPGQAIKTSFRKQPCSCATSRRRRSPRPTPFRSRRCAIRRRWSSAPRRAITNWLITLGVCTHLGCVPLGAGEGENRGRSAAISAPATARPMIPPAASARVRRRRTSRFPKYAFTSDTVVVVG